MITLDFTFDPNSEELDTVFNKEEEYSFNTGKDEEFNLTFKEGDTV